MLLVLERVVGGELLLIASILLFMLLMKAVRSGRGGWLLRIEMVTNIILAVLVVTLPAGIMFVWAGVLEATLPVVVEMAIALVLTAGGIALAWLLARLLVGKAGPSMPA